MLIRGSIAAALFGTAMPFIATPAIAQSTETVRQFDLPAQDLGTSLRTVGRLSGTEIIFQPESVEGRTAPTVHGTMTVRRAVEQLLRGSGLNIRIEGAAIVIRGRSQEMTSEGTPATANDILVLGTRIANAKSTSATTRLTAADIRRAGQADLGETIRDLPQNFSGGQNPGIGTSQGAGNANANVNGASSVNLLGMGPNATLTLLNGNRISYSGVNAAIDVSAIPIAAVDHIDVATDGASAIYGADAVAGVVNIALRRDYKGTSILARLGATTDGGGFQQQYSATIGQVWRSGSILAAYDYTSNAAILAQQRSYASGMAPDSTIYPRLTRNAGLLSVHQDMAAGAAFSVDMLYKDTSAYMATGYFADLPVSSSGGSVDARSRTFLVTPAVDFEIGGTWKGKAVVSYNYDKTRTYGDIFFDGSLYGTSYRRYDNTAFSAELNANGKLVELPAGAVRVAVGAGYRRTTIQVESVSLGSGDAFDRGRTNTFGFAEMNVPLASPSGNHPLVRSLAIVGAIRHETNTGVDAVTTPKVGMIYEPVEGLTLKANWGRSFRLPTFYQQYVGYSAILLPVSGYGSTFPQGAAFLELLGAGPNMKPERSQSWTVSAEFQPRALPGFSGAISYFHFDYTDRVATPLSSSAGVLTNPIYADLVTAGPSAQALTTLISGANGGLQNGTGKPFNPSSVVAVLDARDRNVARQRYEGVNLYAKYHFTLPGSAGLDLNTALTWLRSKQQLVLGLPFSDLAGTIFNPPHFKSRLGVTYSDNVIAVSAYGNLAASVIDNRQVPSVAIGNANTIDIAGQFKLPHGLEVGLTVNNLFNAKPTRIYTTSAYDTPWDTTNYTSLGRFIAFSVRTNW